MDWTNNQIMAFAAIGFAALAVVFMLMALVRYLAQRAAEKPRPTAGLDLERLRRQLETGQISREEFAAIRRQVAGAGPPEAPPDAGPAQPAGPGDQTPNARPGPAGTETNAGHAGGERPIMDTGNDGGEPPRSDDGQDR